MKNGKNIGLMLFLGGIILLILYGLVLGFEELMKALNMVSGALIGLILIGLIILITTIVFEQRKDTQETMKKIKKEDLKP